MDGQLYRVDAAEIPAAFPHSNWSPATVFISAYRWRARKRGLSASCTVNMGDFRSPGIAYVKASPTRQHFSLQWIPEAVSAPPVPMIPVSDIMRRTRDYPTLRKNV